MFKAHGGRAADLSSQTLNTPQAVVAALTEAGFEILRASAEEFSVVYPDAEAWWDQIPGCMNVNNATLPPDDLQRFRGDILTLVRALKDDDGVHDSRTAVFVVAQKGPR